MKCLRCGYCCTSYDVVIVKPEFVNDTFKVDSVEKAKEVLMIKKGGDICPHFEMIEVKANCKIHHRKWYKETPCFSHGQIEQSINDHCRIGDYMLNKRQGGNTK